MVFAQLASEDGGSGEIRTHEGLAPLPVFKTGAFNRSATLPILLLSPILTGLTNLKPHFFFIT